VRVDILLTPGKHLHDRSISLRGEAWAHKTNLTRPLLLKCLRQERKMSGNVPIKCVDLAPLSTTMWHFIAFHFII
jgi:hypothetical protein